MKRKSYSGALEFAVGLFALAMTTILAADYQFEKSFGTFGTASGRFDSPRGVAVNSSQQIVVSESGNNRIQICSDEGSCTAFGSFGVLSGEFDRPRGVAIDNADKIVVADRGNDRIQICSSSGSCNDFGGSGTAVGKFESPRGVAVNSQGQIIVADTEYHRIQVCSAQGSCTAFGSLGSSPGQFDFPAGVAIDHQGRIVVSDRGNDRIQLCTTQGSCTAFGGPGTGLGKFNGPTGVAVDSQNRIVIVDRFNNRVQVCSDQGGCSSFGSKGSSPGLFDLPWGVAVDDQDRIIVADLGNHRIQIFSEAASAVVINSFTASPGSIDTGQSATLSWSVENATECTPLNGTEGWSGLSIDPSGGSARINFNSPGSFSFTLRCTGKGESVSSSVTVRVFEPVAQFQINASLNDAWFYPVTSGQGFFIIVWEDIKFMFLAWFTYDTERPPDDVNAYLGEPGHRWVTAQGPYDGDTATLEVVVSGGGIFDSPEPVVESIQDGYMTVTFTGCNAGLVSYEITSLDLFGEVPIERIVLDNVPRCEALME